MLEVETSYHVLEKTYQLLSHIRYQRTSSVEGISFLADTFNHLFISIVNYVVCWIVDGPTDRLPISRIDHKSKVLTEFFEVTPLNHLIFGYFR